MTEPITILLVEDNPGDVRLTQEALRDSQMPNRMYVVNDGEAALQFLRNQGIYASMPRPDIVLLDLNLPRRDGREVLAALKQDDALRAIPVIVLTTSDDSWDIRKAYDLHANCYITKPVDYGEFIHIIKMIENFWFNVAKLPS
jgi:two-component system, chemotaxis family, response regulator Rcp1